METVVGFAVGAVAFLILVASLLFLSGQLGAKRLLPPGPRPWPVIGNLPDLANGKVGDTLRGLASRYGPLYRLKIGSWPVVVVASSELARVILREQDGVFAHRPTPAPFALREFSRYTEPLAFMPYGRLYTFIRKVMMLEVVSNQRLVEFKAIRESEFDALLKSIAHVVEKQSGNGRESAIQILPFVMAGFTNFLTRTAISQRLYVLPGEIPGDPSLAPKETSKGGRALNDVSRMVTTTFMVGDWLHGLGFLDAIFRRGAQRQIKQMWANIDAFLQSAIDDRRRLDLDAKLQEQQQHDDADAQKKSPRDMLDVLLALQETQAADLAAGHSQESAFPLSDNRVKGFIEMLIVGGVDNPTASVEWLLTELVLHPDCLAKVQEELDRVVGTERKVEESDLPKLPYLKAVIREVWRMHPPSSFLLPRSNCRDTEVAGYHIPANTTAMIHIGTIYRDPALWPKPDCFLPERFLDWQGPDIVTGQEFKLMPFGSGRRMCPGFLMGNLMLELSVARLIHTFNWSLPGELKSRPQDLCMETVSGAVDLRLQRLEVVLSVRVPAAL